VIFGLSFDDEIFFSVLMVVVLDYSSIGTVFQILLQFWSFSHGCREEDYPHNICPGCYVLDNGDSYTRLSNDVDQAVRSLFPGILVLVLSPMWIDYFNGCVRARSLGIAAQIKNMGAPLLVFAGILYDICAIIFWLPSEKYKIMS
jgi:hypothetical protein